MEFIQNNWEQILTGVTSVVGGFSILATLTPNQSDNRVVDVIMQVINLLCSNVGKIKNATRCNANYYSCFYGPC